MVVSYSRRSRACQQRAGCRQSVPGGEPGFWEGPGTAGLADGYMLGTPTLPSGRQLSLEKNKGMNCSFNPLFCEVCDSSQLLLLREQVRGQGTHTQEPCWGHEGPCSRAPSGPHPGLALEIPYVPWDLLKQSGGRTQTTQTCTREIQCPLVPRNRRWQAQPIPSSSQGISKHAKKP